MFDVTNCQTALVWKHTNKHPLVPPLTPCQWAAPRHHGLHWAWARAHEPQTHTHTRVQKNLKTHAPHTHTEARVGTVHKMWRDNKQVEDTLSLTHTRARRTPPSRHTEAEASGWTLLTKPSCLLANRNLNRAQESQVQVTNLKNKNKLPSLNLSSPNPHYTNLFSPSKVTLSHGGKKTF